ncbi:MAG: Crp/Fnr family transcriptional regulator [Alphaproteobacteria bacterium]|nr:Crp/Fnr family transcriptional regulator [Alphaproteobacteria bacterium]
MSITFEKVLVLKNIPMFESASEMALSDLIAASEEKTYKAGDVIIDNEKENSFLFIVLFGKAGIVQDGEIVQEFAPRQIFGETTVLSPAILPHPIKAIEKTIVLKISGHRLYQVMSLHPSVAKGFIGELSKRLR